VLRRAGVRHRHDRELQHPLRPVLAHLRRDRLGALRRYGILFLGPESKRLNRAAAERGPRSPEVQARLRRILLVARVDVALMFLIVFDMVAKPFS
jgi:hypothetical protein